MFVSPSKKEMKIEEDQRGVWRRGRSRRCGRRPRGCSTYVANAGLHYLQARLLLQRLLLLDCKTQAEEASSVSSGHTAAHVSLPEARRLAADTEDDGKKKRCRSESDVKPVMGDD